MSDRIEVMVDAETLSRRPDAALVEVAVVSFTDEEGPLDHLVVRLDPRWSPGHREVDTIVNFWGRSDLAEVKAEVMSGKLLPDKACQELNSFLYGLRVFAAATQHPEDLTFWANSPRFDFVILENLFRTQGFEFPIPFRSERDFRTMSSEARLIHGIDLDPLYADRTGVHSALEDARFQIKVLRYIRSQLRARRR